MIVQRKRSRYQFAIQNDILGDVDSGEGILSDEKKSNLDCRDGFSYYWRDIREEPRVFSKLQQGGKSVMVWRAMSYSGVSNLMPVNDKHTSVTYTEVLHDGRLDFAERPVGDTFHISTK